MVSDGLGVGGSGLESTPYSPPVSLIGLAGLYIYFARGPGRGQPLGNMFILFFFHTVVL